MRRIEVDEDHPDGPVLDGRWGHSAEMKAAVAALVAVAMKEADPRIPADMEDRNSNVRQNAWASAVLAVVNDAGLMEGREEEVRSGCMMQVLSQVFGTILGNEWCCIAHAIDRISFAGSDALRIAEYVVQARGRAEGATLANCTTKGSA